MEARDWVQGVASSELRDAGEALAVLRQRDPEGDWSVSEEDGFSHLLVGDQWIIRSPDPTEFDALVVGAVVAVALLRR